MKNKILLILVFVVFLSFCSKVFASGICSPNGYTVLTVNGIFTDENGAKNNSLVLKKLINKDTYNNQSLNVDYLYNATHLAGLSDLVETAAQKFFSETSDYDLTNIINDASQKVTTQKILLVAHSQGNYYANNFYDTIASQPGGVPKESIGVYGVASPASHVAGDGKYITSSTDGVINKVRLWGLANVLKPNADINLPEEGLFDGHDFSNVYLQYEGDRIVSEIKSSLDKLKNNDEQDSQSSCISPPKLSLLHKIKGVAYAVADPTALGIKYAMAGTYNTGVFLANGIKNITLAMGNTVGHLFANALTGFSENENSNPATEVLPENEIANADINIPIREYQIPADDMVIQNENDSNTAGDLSQTTIATTDDQQGLTHGGQNRNGGGNNGDGGGSGGGGGIPNTDTIAPVISIIGANPMDVIKGTVYTDAGATANDDVDGVVSVFTTGSVDTTTLGMYVITYTASDVAGNISTLTRTVNVVADTGAPVITMNGNETDIVQKNSIYTDPGATAVDAFDGVVAVTVTNNVNTSVEGTYTIIYSATDTAGNTATKTRTVIVDGGAKLTHANFVTVSGNYAYVLSADNNSFEIIDISNPALLVHKSSMVHGVNGVDMFGPQSVAVAGNYAYVVSFSDAMHIIDISNPLVPVEKSRIRHNDGGAALQHPVAITISGNYAYIVSDGGYALEIVDISNPLAPTHKGKLYSVGSVLMARPSSVFVSGNYAYVTSTESKSLDIVDVSDPSNPVHRGIAYDGVGGVSMDNPQSVFVSGNYAYVTSRGANALEVINISNPDAPAHAGIIRNSDGGASLFVPSTVSISGNYAYVTSFNGSVLEVLDISDPTHPVHRATLPNNIGKAALNYPDQIFVSGNYAYIASTLSNALEIVNISNPLSPTHAGKILNGEFTHATTPTFLNSEKKFISFDLTSLTPNVIGSIDEMNHAISLSVPNGINVTALNPTFVISAGAATVPTLGESKDFTTPQNYLVYAEDGTTQNYVVTVTILPPAPDTTPPSVTSYTFNGVSSDVTVNPIVSNPLAIVINVSEPVNWTSIKIERESDHTFYKIFMSDSSGCVDGTNTCAKSWNGLLSSGGLLQSGVYKIKLHIKDPSNNEFYDYLTPYVINVDTSI